MPHGGSCFAFSSLPMLRGHLLIRRTLFCALLCLAWTAILQSQQPIPDACAKCHLQARTQPLTQMGLALQTPKGSPILAAHSKLTFRRGEYSYEIDTRSGQSTYTVSDGSNTVSFRILWSFGAGNQTWVFERDGELYESLVSYYKLIDGLDMTTGDDKLPTSSLEEAAGRELIAGEVKDCFGCHSTNSSTDGKLNSSELHPGLSCVSCHKDAPMHLADILRGKQDSVPSELGAISTEEISNFCGQCHRTWEKVVRNHWRGEFNVRFQPYRLANSKCFNGADPRISCVACHDPHQPLAQGASYYDNKCLACHSSSARSSVGAVPAHAPACPVAKANCVSCHMPKVNFPGGRLVYTDHQIRIARPGDPYPN
jgi:hypothetical protein